MLWVIWGLFEETITVVQNLQPENHLDFYWSFCSFPLMRYGLLFLLFQLQDA